MSDQELDKFLIELKRAVSQRAKAYAEEKICNMLGIASKDTGRPKLKALGINYDALEKRKTILRSKSELAWELLDEKHHSLRQIYKLVNIALKDKDNSVDVALKNKYDRVSKNKSFHVQNTNGKITYVKNPATKKEKISDGWKEFGDCISKVCEAIEKISSIELKDINPIEHAKLKSDLELETKAFIHQYKLRINLLKKHGISSEVSSSTINYRKIKAVKALNETGITVPPRGKPMTKEYVYKTRNVFKKKLAATHPDKDLNNPSLHAEFLRISENFKIFEEYVISSLEIK
jgi:hypothetical protein